MGYYLVILLVKLLSRMPFGMLYALSDLLYYPTYYVVRYRRRIVRKNLTSSFPDKSREEIIAIEKKFYHFLVDMILESCKLATITPEEMKSRLKFVNVEILNDLLSQGKSVSVFIGHYCNWEWMSSIGLQIPENATCAQVYHKLRNKNMDALMRGLRERLGSVCVSMRKTARFLANTVNDDRAYIMGLIADQSPKYSEIKHYVQFLNHSVPVLVGTEKMTKHYGYEAMFLRARRVKRGYYECELSFLCDNPRSLPDYELCDRYFKLLEEEIQDHPEFYLWTHNRFKYARS